MDTAAEKAYAKLNISLDVLKKREDGYHNMVMVMQTVSLSDDVTVALNSGGRVFARCNFPFIPGDERNLAVKAALRFLQAVGREGQGISININKRIPVGAGMAGGSADAAAVLRAMNRLFDSPLSASELEELAAYVGSDVAFCVSGGTVLATGRGEILEELPPLPECRFLICKPGFSISTPELFKKLDQISLRRHPDTNGIISSLTSGDLTGVCRRMYNVFEDVDDRRLRCVSEIKSEMLDAGALGAIMTGTGSAVFGVFRPDAVPEAAARRLRREFGFCEEAKAIARMEV